MSWTRKTGDISETEFYFTSVSTFVSRHKTNFRCSWRKRKS